MNRQESREMTRQMIAERAARYEKSYTQDARLLRRRVEQENAPTQQTDAINIHKMFKGRAHGKIA